MTPTERDRTGPTAPTEDPRIAWVRTQQAALWRYLRLLGAADHELDDVMQDAFVALFHHYPHEPERSQVRLLRTIARRRLIELRRSPALAEWTDAVDAWLQQAEDPLDDSRSEQLGSCLEELTERARNGLTLRHVDGRDVDEIAAALGLQRTGTLSLLQRARDQLRACMARRGAVSATTKSSTPTPTTTFSRS